jgi:hypothetical protein
MKIYLAGLALVGSKNSESENVMLTEEVRRTYPYDLESYHYVQSNRTVADYYREHKKTIFMDSGAYSMFTQGIAVDLSQYAEYINTNRDWIHIASNLDAIGKEEIDSYRNQKALEKMVKSPEGFLCPVHHARDADKWLLKYIADGYDYIFLGGMVPESTGYLRQWLDHLWDKYLTNKDGSAKIKVHGFGLTTIEVMERYPWYSVDSTRWVLLGRYGMILLDMPTENRIITLSTSSPRVHDEGQHLDNMDHYNRAVIIERLQELGYDPDQLRTMYGYRDKFNIEFFRRLGERLNPLYPKDKVQRGVWDA